MQQGSALNEGTQDKVFKEQTQISQGSLAVDLHKEQMQPNPVSQWCLEALLSFSPLITVPSPCCLPGFGGN